MRTAKDYRRRAASEIRAARMADSSMERHQRMVIAKGLKMLATTEEWLAGEPQKSAPRSARKVVNQQGHTDRAQSE